jgi:hypothetical protein
MKFSIFILILFASTATDGQQTLFPRSSPNSKSVFVSSGNNNKAWTSEERQYCFLRKELSYEMMYESSPVPIPNFKIMSEISNVFLTVDSDPAHPIRQQRLTDEWIKFLKLAGQEKICFEGAYLPPTSPDGAAFIMVSKIQSQKIQLAVSDYWMPFDE